MKHVFKDHSQSDSIRVDMLYGYTHIEPATVIIKGSLEDPKTDFLSSLATVLWSFAITTTIGYFILECLL